MIWFRKYAALLLLCVGGALTFLPFPTDLAGERTQEVVQLRVQPAPFTEESVRARFGDSFIQLSYEGMAEFPDVREAVLGLMDRSGSRCVSPDEWHALLADRSVTDPEGVAYAFRDGLYQIASVEGGDYGPEDNLVCFEAMFLGAYDNLSWSPMARLEASDLDGYPDVKAELERLASGPIPAEGGRDISPRRWRRFQHRELDDRGYWPYFVALDRLFSGVVEDETVPWSLQTPWLRQAAGAVGGVAMLLGLLMLVASYRAVAARPGIPISSAWFGVFCDVISLVGSSIFTVLAIDTLWVGPLGQSSLLGLNPDWPSTQPITGLHFISVPVFFVVIPLLTLWFTSLSAQRIQVDGERVTSHGALGSRSIPWEGLERVHLREQRNPFAFSVGDSRSLQTALELEGADHSITINEPGSGKRKMQILDALIRHVPDAKKDLIKSLGGQW